MAKKLKTYIDGKGYMRFNATGKLLHRKVAYDKIYSKNPDNYPYSFGYYEIHHKDGNKLNNYPSNLQIVTPEEHQKIHGIEVPISEFPIQEINYFRVILWILSSIAILVILNLILFNLLFKVFIWIWVFLFMILYSVAKTPRRYFY